jgi:hypothetical protein
LNTEISILQQDLERFRQEKMKGFQGKEEISNLKDQVLKDNTKKPRFNADGFTNDIIKNINGQFAEAIFDPKPARPTSPKSPKNPLRAFKEDSVQTGGSMTFGSKGSGRTQAIPHIETSQFLRVDEDKVYHGGSFGSYSPTSGKGPPILKTSIIDNFVGECDRNSPLVKAESLTKKIPKSNVIKDDIEQPCTISPIR